jgi:hypothetical protein
VPIPTGGAIHGHGQHQRRGELHLRPTVVRLPGVRAFAETTDREAIELFLREYEIVRIDRHRSKEPVEGHRLRPDAHLLRFFGDMSSFEITSGRIQEYRLQRPEKTMPFGPGHLFWLRGAPFAG